MKRQQDKLLIIIAMSGEMPTYLGQYVTGSISYTAALITRLKKERYISLRCKDGYRGYVLLEKGRNYLLSEYEKELSFFISGSGQTGHVKSEPEKRMRLYRMSEVWVFFWKAGIEILRNHKPDMDKGFVRDRGKAFYYGSLEFKGMSEAIRGSRSCGVLLSGDTVLVVYNTMDRNMKWAKKMECSMRTWTERMLLKGGYNSKADALIVGQNIKVLLKLLESDGGIKKDLFRPDDIYDQYYYIPMCREGILQIVLLTEKRKREKLKQSLFSRFTEENTDIEYPLCSYQAVERAIRIQISYDALKNDHPYDRRVEEILGLILDVMVSTAPKLRINREEKDIEIVKAQFAKLTKDHVEFVLQSMDDTSTKARNIRAVLLTALYNSVNTINSYYGNRYHFHLAEETRREMEETD